MGCRAEAIGTNNVDNPEEQIGVVEDWFNDPARLAQWQGQLVESCHEISQQLSEIQNDLSQKHTPAIPFRLIKAYSGGSAN